MQIAENHKCIVNTYTGTHTQGTTCSVCVCVCVDCTCKCYHSWLVTVSVSHRPQPQDVRLDSPGCLFECVSVGVLKLLRENLWSSQSVQPPLSPLSLPLSCFASLPNPFEQVLLVIRHFAWPKIKFLLSIIYGLICLPLRAALQELTWQQLINYSTKATYKPSSRTGI